MLVNPEIYAWIHRLSQPKTVEKKRPSITRGEATAQAGTEDKAHNASYVAEGQARSDKVEYLNERQSDYNFYA